MSSPSINKRTIERLKAIDEAIVNLKRAKNKLSIAQIAKKSGIARKTIYNHDELKEETEKLKRAMDQFHKMSMWEFRKWKKNI